MMLEVRGLSAFYGANQALHGIDFSLDEGGIIALLGANGAGKTTTLRALCGMVRCSGEIRFGDRALVGRALMLRPRLMLLDEPSFGLAPLVVEELFAILRRLNRELAVGMLIVEQNAALALDLAEHAYLLETGRIVMAGPAQEIGRDEAVRRAYLGY